MGDLTEHFSRWEFDCPHCGRGPRPTAALLAVLERVRERRGAPMTIVSGYRCPAHNRAVGGHPQSQHLLANAADVWGDYAPLSWWRTAGAIGCGVRGGKVIHVDMTPGRRHFTFNE
jgi:uncharacterized protein YcbK (DUF882 family)